MSTKARPLFDRPIVMRAIFDSLKKLHPQHQMRNPVMFTVFIGSLLTTGLGIHALGAGGSESPTFILGVSAWLWFTVLFANFAEAMAEGRGKAQADSLRATRRDVTAKKLNEPRHGAEWNSITASLLRKDDVVLKRGVTWIVWKSWRVFRSGWSRSARDATRTCAGT